VSNDNSIANITVHPPTMEPGSKTCEELDAFFRADAAIDHVVFVKDHRPTAMLTRQMFYTSLGGPVQYAFFQHKPADSLAKSAPLTVHERMEITQLGRLAMTRPRDEVYEPVIVIDSAGCFTGTVTMKQLLYKFINYEIRIAADSNPLTNLPGNRIIDQWIETALESPPFTIIYGDLDRFKEYNDAYGFNQGDKAIKFAARILTEFASSLGSAEVGHIGGDDFVVIVPNLLSEETLKQVSIAFDQQKKELFKDEDFERGFYEAEDRSGNVVKAPLITISLAVITSDNLKTRTSLEGIAQIAASLKKRVKNMNAQNKASGFVQERRTYT
jgi:diguanylate cyclase (GGDEF)-like protein